MKKDQQSVGVARQCCGHEGKQENRQVAVSASAATSLAGLAVGLRLAAPEKSAQGAELRHRRGMPQEIRFETKPEIGLRCIDRAMEQDVPLGVVAADCANGSDTNFREWLALLRLACVVRIQ